MSVHLLPSRFSLSCDRFLFRRLQEMFLFICKPPSNRTNVSEFTLGGRRTNRITCDDLFRSSLGPKDRELRGNRGFPGWMWCPPYRRVERRLVERPFEWTNLVSILCPWLLFSGHFSVLPMVTRRRSSSD